MGCSRGWLRAVERRETSQLNEKETARIIKIWGKFWSYSVEKSSVSCILYIIEQKKRFVVSLAFVSFSTCVYQCCCTNQN